MQNFLNPTAVWYEKFSINFGSGPVSVIHQSFVPNPLTHTVTISNIGIWKEEDSSQLQQLLSIPDIKVAFKDMDESISVDCNSKHLPDVVSAIASLKRPDPDVKIAKLEPLPVQGQGQGRIKWLEEPMTLKDVVKIAKEHCNVSHLRLATAVGATIESEVKSIAVCCGSGSSVLSSCKADVWVTGEMSHHDVLNANHNGTSVILVEHSNSERGFLQDFKTKLSDILQSGNEMRILVSQRDRDPLVVV